MILFVWSISGSKAKKIRTITFCQRSKILTLNKLQNKPVNDRLPAMCAGAFTRQNKIKSAETLHEYSNPVQSTSF